MTMSITQQGTVEYAGAMKFRFMQLDVTNYTGSGENFSPSDAGMNRFHSVEVTNSAGSGYMYTYDYSNDLIQAWESSFSGGTPFDEVGSGTDLGTARALCIGR